MDRNKSPSKNPHSKWGFFFVDLASPLHDTSLQYRKIYPKSPMLPVRKFEMEFLHTKKWWGNKPPCPSWKSKEREDYIQTSKIKLLKYGSPTFQIPATEKYHKKEYKIRKKKISPEEGIFEILESWERE